MDVREYLTKYNEEKGWTTDDRSLIETLVDLGEVVHREGRDEHRWYIIETAVAKVGDVFIQYLNYVITGDNNMSDMDLEYDLDAARIVQRKYRQITEVYYE